MNSLRFWFFAFRPKTLTAALAPILASVALTKAFGHPFPAWIPVAALLASLCIQIATNLVNDAKDFKKGADTEERLGPQRVTAGGVFSYQTVMRVAYLFFVFAILFGLPLVVHGGAPIFLIGIISLICGYAYTGGPFPLAYRGLGDLFVILFFGLVAVMGLTFLMTQMWRFESGVIGLQVGFLCAVLIAINNLRDIYTDQKVNKKTLAVRLGVGGARKEIAVLVIVPFVLGIYWISIGWIWAGLLPFLISPMAFKLLKSVFLTEPSQVYNQLLAKSAALHLIFTVLLSIGLLLV